MFENVDGRTEGRRTEAGVTGILIAHLGALGSGELKSEMLKKENLCTQSIIRSNYGNCISTELIQII